MKVEITPEILSKMMPSAKAENIHKYSDILKAMMPEFGINTELRVAHFIAQLAHESASFKYSSENLNYSAKALRSVFGKYFKSNELAEEYARKPEKIANRVYGSRMGNGDEESGDGWKYRGRGLIQLTGKNNYRACGKALFLDFENQPQLLSDDPRAAVAAACWFWNERNLSKYADEDDVKSITKRINGGYNGLDDRIKYLSIGKSVLGIE